MKYLKFEWDGDESLIDRLSQPIDRISIWRDRFGRPLAAQLWHRSGATTRIHSHMHDVAERIEVGVLAFSKTKETTDLEETIFEIPSSFWTDIAVDKLTIAEAGVTAESGIVIKGSHGRQIVVVAGADPHSLAISVLSSTSSDLFEPEYDLTDYKRVPISTPTQ